MPAVLPPPEEVKYGVQRCLARSKRTTGGRYALDRLGFHLATAEELDGHSLSPTDRMYVR